MKKILAWDDEKKALVLEEQGELGKQFTLDYYGEDIPWESKQFDSLFTAEAKLDVFVNVIDNRLDTIRTIIDELELIKRKLTIVQRDLSFKDEKDGDTAPF